MTVGGMQELAAAAAVNQGKNPSENRIFAARSWENYPFLHGPVKDRGLGKPGLMPSVRRATRLSF